MYPKLTEKSFLKIRPDTDLFSPYKDGFRDSVKINKTAADILSFCDGTNSFDYIVEELKNKYNENEDVVRKNIKEFLLPLIKLGIIENKTESIKKANSELRVRGSRKIFYPDILIWEVTDFCPLNCKHCYLTKKNNNIFSKKEIQKILGVIDKSGVYQVQLTGGEALSHPNIEYIIDELVQRGIIVSISTSGVIFNDKILSSLIKLKNVHGSFVRVSLDGNEITHNDIRQNKSAYKRALNFIKTLKEYQIPCQIGTTIVNQTKDELEDVTKVAKENGVCLIEFGLLTIQGNAKENHLNSFLSQRELISFLKILSDKFTDDKFIVKIPNEKGIIKNCGAGYQIIVIKANKDVAICPTAEFTVGKLDNCEIEDIMFKCGKEFSNITSPNEKVCGNCKNQIECMGCISRALILKNTVKRCKWFESEYKHLKPFLTV